MDWDNKTSTNNQTSTNDKTSNKKENIKTADLEGNNVKSNKTANNLLNQYDFSKKISNVGKKMDKKVVNIKESIKKNGPTGKASWILTAGIFPLSFIAYVKISDGYNKYYKKIKGLSIDKLGEIGCNREGECDKKTFNHLVNKSEYIRLEIRNYLKPKNLNFLEKSNKITKEDIKTLNAFLKAIDGRTTGKLGNAILGKKSLKKNTPDFLKNINNESKKPNTPGGGNQNIKTNFEKENVYLLKSMEKHFIFFRYYVIQFRLHNVFKKYKSALKEISEIEKQITLKKNNSALKEKLEKTVRAEVTNAIRHKAAREQENAFDV